MKKLFYSVFAIVFAALTFTSCDDVPMPYDTPEANSGGTTYEGAEGEGTLESPYNVAGALQFISALEPGVNSENAIYIKGTISSIEEEFGSFGNATYYITDPGSKYTFYVYRSLFLNNQKWKSGNTQIQIGDEVIICGKVVNFKGTTPETVANDSYLYKLNNETSTGGGGTTGEAKGRGTQNDPYNPVAAINAVKDLTWTANSEYQTTEEVFVKGKISRIADNGTYTASGTNGNATFWISEDGSTNDEFQCFRVLYLGNKKFSNGADIKVGDNVIIYGKLMNYRGNTPETVANQAYLFELNGDTEGIEGNNGHAASGDGSEANPYNVPGAIAKASATGAFVKGYIVGCVEDKSISSATFSAGSSQTNILIAASDNETSTANCMAVQLPTGDIRTKLNLNDNPGNLHKAVVLYGNIETYFGQVGMKSVTYAVLDGTEIGKKPGSTDPNPNPNPTGGGTLDNPYSVSDAINAVSGLTWTSNTVYDKTDVVYVKGKISRIANKGTYTEGGEYGNATFFISDDGNTANEFQCFRVLYLNNTKFNKYNGDKVDIKVGYNVIICGKLMNYKGNTPETVANEAYLYKLN